MDWTILKVFIEFVTLFLLSYVLVFWLWSMWDLSSLMRDQICTPALEGEVLNTGPPGKSLRIILDAWHLQGASSLFLFWKHYMNSVININADGDCNHEIKRCLLLGRKSMTNLDSILKSRDITLMTKFCLVKAMVFASSHVWMWELDYKESWVPKNWCFRTVVLEKTLESPLDCKDIKPVHPKGNKSWIFIGRTDAEAETPILWPTWCEELTHWKRPWFWERLKAGGEGDDKE